MRSSFADRSFHPGSLSAQRLTVFFLYAGLLAPIVFIPFVLWAGITTPGYSQISSTFSDAAAQGQPHPEIMGTGLLLLGSLLALFALGCYRAFPRHNRRVAAAVMLTALAILGTGLFHDYNRSSAVPHNAEGFLHNTFATIAVLSATAAILLSGMASRGQRRWDHLFLPAFCFAVSSAGCGYLFQTVSDTRDGLAERGFTIVALGWIVIVSLTAIWSFDDGKASRSLIPPRSPDGDVLVELESPLAEQENPGSRVWEPGLV